MKNKYTRSEKIKLYKDLAVEYIEQQRKDVYYVATYPSLLEDDPTDYGECVLLNEEQKKEILTAMEVSAKEEICLFEYYQDMGTPDYLLPQNENCHEPSEVELETPHYRIKVKVATFPQGLDFPPQIIKSSIFLVREEYLSLLIWGLMNREHSYNDLYKYDSELFAVINDKIRWIWNELGDYPTYVPAFAVELVGIKEDAMSILGPLPEGEFIYQRFGPPLQEATFLHIENRQLSFTYNNSEFKSHIIEDVDAIALQNTLGVESYKEIVDYFFEKFGGKDGVKIFKTFLDTNGTAYSERGTF